MNDGKLKSGTVPVGNGAELYYEERGSGPVLLFVHGLWGSSRFFRAQLEGLSKRYRVIAVDLRGHGRSSMTLSHQTVPAYARDLRAFIEQLGLGEFVAAGWSMGAFVWWDYYLQFGAAGAKGLVVIDQPPSDWRSPEIPNALLSVEYLRDWHFRAQTDKDAFIREVIPMMFAKPPSEADLQWMHEEMTKAPGVILAAVLVDQSLREYQDTLWEYPIPTLVCGGRHSAQPRAGLELIIERIRDGRLVSFEASGHCLFIEEAERFNAEVDAFAWPLLDKIET
jgi:pimeloyl-ACP methyl ester carboxylesterase